MEFSLATYSPSLGLNSKASYARYGDNHFVINGYAYNHFTSLLWMSSQDNRFFVLPGTSKQQPMLKAGHYQQIGHTTYELSGKLIHATKFDPEKIGILQDISKDIFCSLVHDFAGSQEKISPQRFKEYASFFAFSSNTPYMMHTLAIDFNSRYPFPLLLTQNELGPPIPEGNSQLSFSKIWHLHKDLSLFPDATLRPSKDLAKIISSAFPEKK